MLVPIYSDEVDEYDDPTYQIIGYDSDGESICFISEEDTVESAVERITQREIEELLETSLLVITVDGFVYDLEDFLLVNINEIIGMEIKIECT